MSFGMLSDLTKIVGGSPDALMALDLDPRISEVLTACLLAERDATGKIVETPVFHVSIEDAERMFDWVKEHLLTFFMRRLSSTKKLFEGRIGEIKDLGLSLNGTASEALKTPLS